MRKSRACYFINLLGIAYVFPSLFIFFHSLLLLESEPQHTTYFQLVITRIVVCDSYKFICS